MRYLMKVGKVVYDIESPVPLPWRDSDLSFQLESPPDDFSCHVVVREVKEISGESDPCYQSNGIAARVEPNGVQIRTHRAMYAKNRPVFARSIEGPEGIVIEALTSGEAWNNLCISVWSLLHLENHLLDTGGLILHCCYLMQGGEAILFTAPSGIGKTTQGKLWEQIYGAEIINGDRAVLQRDPEGWLAMGYPFHGSAPECRNESYPVKAIAIVQQAEGDWVEEVSPAEAAILLYEGITVNVWDKEKSMQALDLLQELIADVPIVRLHCTMGESAAKTLHNYLYGG